VCLAARDFVLSPPSSSVLLLSMKSWPETRSGDHKPWIFFINVLIGVFMLFDD